MKLYRVFPYDANADPSDPFGALYLPDPSTLGRIANIDLYRERYFAGEPEGAIAESFGRLPSWQPIDFQHPSGFPYALQEYSADPVVCNLDDAEILLQLGLKQPSHVVTSKRQISQAWARQVFQLSRYDAVSWWSRYYPEWTIVGTWNDRNLEIVGTPDILTTQHPLVVAAADVIVRQIA